MRKRSSVYKAEWSNTREEQYKRDTLEIVFGFGDTLEVTDSIVCINHNGAITKVAEPIKSNTFWFETWLKVKEQYGI